MIVRSVFAALLFLSALPLAAAFDLQAVSLTLDKNAAVTGERVEAVLRVRNNGPDPAENVTAYVTTSRVMVYLDASAPAGWNCTPTPMVFGGCTAASLAAGAEADIRLVFLVAPTPSPQEQIIAGVQAAGETQPRNNTILRQFPVTAAPDLADLTLSSRAASEVIRQNEESSVELTLQNAGPAAARNVHVSIRSVGRQAEAIPFQARGEGWTCTESAPGAVICVRQSIEANASSRIAVRFTAPEYETVLAFNSIAIAERSHDPSGNVAYEIIGVGAASNWLRLLIPLANAFGPTPWRVDVTMLIRSDTPIEIHPHPCELISITCYIGAPPLRRQFDAHFNTILPTELGEPGAAFLYIRPQDIGKLAINSRVYHAEHAGRTAGSEIPIARDNDFTTGRITLLGIPAGSAYRQMLRVYDTNDTAGTSVEVRVYANDETEPRVTELHALQESLFSQRTTTAFLPTHPRYAQIDLRAFDQALAGAETLRVEVRPVTAGSRIWSFVSITNNETQHVTVVSR